MPWIVAVFKPLVFLWVGLNLIDDLALFIRVGRLGLSMIPYPGKAPEENMCGVCDDVVGDLMVGKDGISAIPCPTACFGRKGCTEMCEKVKETSETSTEFPCVAAGFCDPMKTGYVNSVDIDCKGGPFFSCQPSQFCRRKREKFKMVCELKPGIGRWNGMKHLASFHTAALAAGLKSQLYCGEEGAGQYCIAKPTGTGLIAEWIGHFISLAIGGYKSVTAIETPGGNDDRQWLTFWLIFSLWLFCERFFLSIILSNVPLYYECKLACLVWLIWMAGAEKCYRRLRRVLPCFGLGTTYWSDFHGLAAKSLEIMQDVGGDVVKQYLAKLSDGSKFKKEMMMMSSDEWTTTSNRFWQYDNDNEQSSSTTVDANGDPSSTLDPQERLYYLSKFLLSSEGSKQMEESKTISEADKVLLIERAAEVVSFQPRYLNVTLLGSIREPRGELPPMDPNGKADGYVICRLVPSSSSSHPYPRKGVKSRTAYRTTSPQWNQELEIPLRGGKLHADGYFQSGEDIQTTQLHLSVLDADVGLWSWVLYIFQALIVAGVVLLLVAYVEGTTDDATGKQKLMVLAVAAVVFAGYALGYVMAVMRRSDDEIVGFCTVPLGILFDQKEHTLLLTLHPDESGGGGGSKKNATGGYGVIRVKLMLVD